jgi:hypothetical protein
MNINIWAALETFAACHARISMDDFMFMEHVADPDVYAYKHRDTRRYLILGADGITRWIYAPDGGFIADDMPVEMRIKYILP